MLTLPRCLKKVPSMLLPGTLLLLLCILVFSSPILNVRAENPESSRQVGVNQEDTAASEFRIFLPPALRGWPEKPGTPAPLVIDNADQDNNYSITWAYTPRVTKYIVEEADDDHFTKPRRIYEGLELGIWNIQKYPGTYYYRVKAANLYAESDWSAVKSITIYPKFVGLNVRWDGVGYVWGFLNYEIGSHYDCRFDALIDHDTIRMNAHHWYDPNPADLDPESWFNYYSVSTGKFKTSSVPDDPSAKWGHSYFLAYDFEFENGAEVLINGQKFQVTGPKGGYTIHGKWIPYWELVNLEKILILDGGGNMDQYSHPGDIVLRYHAGNSKLLLYSSILRRTYTEGEIGNLNVQYIHNLSSTNSIPGFPEIPALPSIFSASQPGSPAAENPIENRYLHR